MYGTFRFFPTGEGKWASDDNLRVVRHLGEAFAVVCDEVQLPIINPRSSRTARPFTRSPPKRFPETSSDLGTRQRKGNAAANRGGPRADSCRSGSPRVRGRYK